MSIAEFFFGRKQNSTNSRRSVKLNRNAVRTRTLSMEPLETRNLLSVTTGYISDSDYSALRAQYPDFNLPEEQSDLNVMVVDLDEGATELKLEDLKTAITEAGTTTQPDLILVKTSASTNSVTYTSNADEITINIGATQYGSITIIGWGEEKFTLNANQRSRVMTVSGVVNLGGLIIQNGKSDKGGGIYISYATLTLANSMISGNTASTGGGIDNYSGTLTVINSMISGNTASDGGGIWNSKTLKVTNSMILGNRASYGGGISNYKYYSEGTVTVTNCTISENTANYSGGGIFSNTGIFNVTNSEISENTASYGGGMYNSYGTLTVTNSTISGNTASYGGGMYNSSAPVSVYNTIVTCNPALNGNSIIDIYNTGGFIDGYYTLSTYTAWDRGNENIVYDSSLPLFIDAKNHDYHLATGSQAIDKGNNGFAIDAEGVGLACDLDDAPRIVNNTVDIGAYEFDMYNLLAVPEFTLSADGSSVIVTISEVENASSYTVLYQIDGTDDWSTIANIQGTSMSFVGVAGTKYNVKVQANATGDYFDSGFSESSSITLDAPSTPLIGLTLSTSSPLVGSTITTTLNPEGATAEYQWYSGSTLIDGATESSFTVTEDQIGQSIVCIATGTNNYQGSVFAITDIVYGYNTNDYQKMVAFLEQTDSDGVNNGTKLNANYNSTDPTTWTGVSWSTVGNEKRISGLSINGKVLVGVADFSNMANLTTLNCSSNQLTSLNVSGCNTLTTLTCNNNQLTALDVSTNTALTTLNCSVNQLTSLDVSGNSALTTLYCNSNQLSSLDVSNHTELTTLNCSSNQLTVLNASGCIKLVNSSGRGRVISPLFNNNPLETINFSGCTSLNAFNYNGSASVYTQLKTVDVSGCTSLTSVNCNYGQVSSLDVSGCTALQTIQCNYNQISSMDLSDCTSLKSFQCISNQLSSLDVSNNALLTTLYVSSNPLTQLELLANNQLTSFRVGNNTNLSNVYLTTDKIGTLSVYFEDSWNIQNNSGETTEVSNGNYAPAEIPFFAVNSSNNQTISFASYSTPSIDLLSVNQFVVAATWSAVENAPCYTLEYQLDDSDDWIAISDIQGTTTSFIGVPGNIYNIRIKANGTGNYSDSNYSPIQTITIPDINLTAHNDFVKTTLNSPIVIDYRDNDEASDWSVVTVQFGEASHGEYVVNEDGTISYTPERGFFGTDTIGYVLFSPSGKASVGSIVISVGLPIATSVQKTVSVHTPSSAMAPSVDSLTDWDNCCVELWAQGVNELNAGETTVTLEYNPAVYETPYFSACAEGVALAASEGVVLPNGNVEIQLTVHVVEPLESQTDNLFLGTVVLTPSEDGFGVEDGSNVPACVLEGVELTTSVETMPYDMNHNGAIDVNDFVSFATVFGTNLGTMSPDNPLYAQALKADFNKDGIVNIDDFIAFSINFGVTKKLAAKPIPQASAAVSGNREWGVGNREDIDAQVETYDVQPTAPVAQPAMPDSQFVTRNSQLELESPMTLLEAYSAALLDLYDNQESFDQIEPGAVLVESRMESPVASYSEDSSQNTPFDVVDAVLEENLLAIDWE